VPRKVKGLGLRATMRRIIGATGSSRPYSNENSRRNGISTAMAARLQEFLEICYPCLSRIEKSQFLTDQARKAETRLARDAASRGSTYGTFAQNDPGKVVVAIERNISRKARMSFAGFDEFWLLLCCGVPEFGAIAATFVMTPWLDTGSLDNATLDKLARSKYSRAFIHAILGAEEKALYQWERGGGWSKSTLLVPPESV